MFIHKLKRAAYYLLLAFFGLVLLYGVGRLVHVWSDSFYQGERGPYLQMPAPTAMTLRWQSSEPVQASVRYGTSLQNLDLKYRIQGKREQHEVRLTGLQPDTRYYYAIYHGERPVYHGVEFRFRTAPPIGATRPVRLWVAGDPGYAGPGQQQVRDAALEWVEQHPRANLPALDFWMTTGDNAYQSGSNQQFQDGFFTPYHRLLRQFPVWPIYGNHDARRWVFFKIFTLPEQAESGGVASGSERYYSFDYANLHVVILDTQSSELAADSAMLEWLQKDLAQSRQPWKIALFHHPPYTHGSHNSDNIFDSDGRMFEVRQHLLPLLEQAGVQLVLSGHSHMYERSYPLRCHYGTSDTLTGEMVIDGQTAPGSVYPSSATLYMVIGSSSKLDNGPLDHPAMPVAHRSMGSVIIDIEQDRIVPRFIDQQGNVKDWFEIRREVGGRGMELNCE